MNIMTILLGVTMTINAQPSFFVIERSKDANQIFYFIRSENHELLTDEPIEIYWIKNTANCQKENLTWIQKKYAYGIKYLEKRPRRAVFQFVSYNKINFIVKESSNGEFKVFANIEQQEITINRIFVHIEGGTYWLPKIPQIDIEGIDVKSNKPIRKSINP